MHNVSRIVRSVITRYAALILVLLSASGALAVPGNISTIAGDGSTSLPDGLYLPRSVHATAGGELYIADTYHHRIQKRNADGTFTTVAGTGDGDFCGDNGPAVNACLFYPSGIFVDPAGNIYVADSMNDRIRKIDTNGIITTVAGGDVSGYTGDGGPAGDALLNCPTGVVVNASGEIFIADSGNNVIRKIYPGGIIITHLFAWQQPYALALEPGGVLYFSTQFMGIWKDAVTSLQQMPSCSNAKGFSVAAPDVVTMACPSEQTVLRSVPGAPVGILAGIGIAGFAGDGGPASAALLNFPSGIAVDASGNVLIADSENNRIRMIEGYDTTPTPFSFQDLTNMPTSTLATSNIITVTGINVPAPVSVTGGEYEVNNSGIWTTAQGTVNNGDTVRVRQTSSANPAATTNTLLTIGGLSDTFSVTTASGSSPVSFSDTLENGTAQWTSITGLWHVVNGTSPYPNSHSASSSWWYGQDGTGNFDTGAANSGEIVSASFPVPSGASLTFWSWEQTEGPGTYYDSRKVYISTNDGANWTQIYQSTDNTAVWYKVTVDLAPYAGMNARLKFVFETVDNVANQYRGWYVDDVAVSGTGSSSGSIKEDFESGNLTKLPWTTGGSGVWTVTGASVHGGAFAAEAPVSINDNQSSYLEVAQTTGTGTISFWYSVSSEQNFDYLRFSIDGVQQAMWSGFIGWTQQSYPVIAGQHIFRWEYSKDGSVSTGSDTAWIDDIEITSGSQPPAQCATAIAPSSDNQGLTSINDLGEVVWSQFDPGTGFNQIYSSTRGQLTFDLNPHDSPSVNNRGDVVWEQKFPWQPMGPIYGVLAGQLVQVAAEGNSPCINDNQEIVWSQGNNGPMQIFSNRRGYLTTDFVDHQHPSINNAGDAVWTQFDPGTGWDQVYKLAAGTTTPVSVTSNAMYHFSAKISNSNEIVWSEGSMPGPGAGARVHSSTRGQLSSTACPAGDDHFAPAVNSCGDVVFTSMTNNFGTAYRLGNASPCVSDTEPNNFLPEATLVSGNTTTMGMVQDPGDWEDWYKFTANAGDPITVTVNWAPTVSPNMLMVELMDQYGGWLAGAFEQGSPKTITYTAMYSGTYHVHLMAMPGSRVGYTVTLKVGIGGGTCADRVSPGDFPSINDLGEVVWSQYQIYSSTRGQLTFDANPHYSPSLNNRGDVVWEQKLPWEQTGPIYGIISGQLVQVAADGNSPSINDSQEIVWSRLENGYRQVYSNRRGFLTSDFANHEEPAINNAGDVVWTQYDPASGWQQVYKLAAGTTPVRLTSSATHHWSATISNSGEIVWSEGPLPGPGAGARVYSSTRGQLSSAACPAGDDHVAPSVNACGDVVFTSMVSGVGNIIYRLGNASPCVVSDTEPNNSITEATLVSGNSTTTGTVQDPGDWEDWYKFTANAGDQIKVTVNWAPTVLPNMLMVDLMDQYGGWLAGAPEPGSPKTITYTAAYSGTYHVHLMTFPGSRSGYTLTLKVGLGGGTCADPISLGSTQQFSSSINDLGEVVWSQFDQATGVNQIYSSTRGQLTSDANPHDSPSLNNLGDVVWEQKFPWEQTGPIYGVISGQLVQVAADGNTPSINDSQEIVWSRLNNGYWQLYSNRRGFLTSDFANHQGPALNNAGDVVWMQQDAVGGLYQIFRRKTGEDQPVQVTSGAVHHGSPSISNSGEVVWSEGPTPGPGAQIYSSIRGRLSSEGCPGFDNSAPAVNACGDVVFTSVASGVGNIYRLGNASPCVSDTEPNNFLPEATLVSGNTTTMGMVQDPGDWEDWYKFTANAGDPITVTVNWAPAVPPNMLMVDLMDQYGGWLAGSPEPGSPRTITYTAQYTGIYHVHLQAMAGSRAGYSLSVKVGIGGGGCADPVAPGGFAPAINDLGETVWSQLDWNTYRVQLYSSTRGQLTFDATWHEWPSLNNRGDVVWVQKNNPSNISGPIFGIISGQLVQVAADGSDPSINDNQEIVWSQLANGYWQLYSNRRGYLTTDPADHGSPTINNAGDLVWMQVDGVTGRWQIYKLAAGSSTPVQLTSDAVDHSAPSISNTGEVVWSQGSVSGMRVHSSTRGQLSFDACPSGADHVFPSINSCGDIVFAGNKGDELPESGLWRVYRLGNNSPCMADIEPNNMLSEATLMSNNTTTMGMVQDLGDWEDWYQFTANAGDQIKVSVNWTPTIFPNMLLVDLMDPNGGWVANAPETGTPKTITYTAQYTGAHYVHLQVMVGRIGYNLALTVIDTSPPAVNIDPVATPTRVTSQTISGTMESGAAVAVSINTAAVAGPVTYPTAATWSCTIAGLTEGENRITASATDAAGNAASREVIITLDIVPPAVSIDPVVSPTKLNFKNISGTRESNATITLTVNTGATVGEMLYPAPATWTCMVSGLTEGPNDITVIAADSVGNSSIVTTSIIVDTVAPVVTISSPAAGLSNVNASLLSYVADPGIVEVKVDGVSVAQRSGQNLNALAEGTHIVRVESTDAAGNTGFGEVTLIVDTLPPTVTVDPVTTPTRVNMQTIGGGRESGALITVTVDTSAFIGPVVYPTETTWSGMVTSLAEGVNVVTITARDAAQNSATVTASITYDSIAPVVSINSPASGATKDDTPRLDFTITGGTAATVSVDGVIISKTSGQDLDSLIDGSHTVRVEATDAAGNPGFAQVTFTVDTIAPGVSINPVSTLTNVSCQTLTGSREESAAVAVAVNTPASPDAIVYPSPTTWSCTVSNLAAGSNTVTVTATDAAGNQAIAAATITFDGIAPAVSITSPGSAPTDDNTPLLTYSASDGSVVVKVDGVVVSRVSGDSLDALSDGSHTVRVESTDEAGNIGFAQVAFIVDTVAPAISINPVATPTKIVSQTITGMRESGASVSVTVNTSASVGVVSYPSATTWSCTTDNLARGRNDITARAVDTAGNNATAAARIIMN
jgi:tartrate dehydratase beta subunit/fumarate hydratase class I family protein